MNCRGDEDIDAKRSRPSIGKPVMGHARKERVVLFGTDQRITSGPAAKRPHSKAEYMTAPERFADSQIPLAPRAPSIHDPEPTFNDETSSRRDRAEVYHILPWIEAARLNARNATSSAIASGDGRHDRLNSELRLRLRNEYASSRVFRGGK